MTNERIRIQQTDAPDLELCLEVFDADAPPGMIPAPGDIADAILNSSGEWWVALLTHVRHKNGARHRSLLQSFVAAFDLAADVAGGDADPGFGVDPKDSAALLELRQAIDSYLGWKSKEDEENGDYVFRIREIGDMLWNCKAAFIDHKDAELMARIMLSVTKHHADIEAPVIPGAFKVGDRVEPTWDPAKRLELERAWGTIGVCTVRGTCSRPHSDIPYITVCTESGRDVNIDPDEIRRAPPLRTHEISAAALTEELDRIDHVLETHGLDSTRAVQELEVALRRLKQLESERTQLEADSERASHLTEKLHRQRRELRRFNRDEVLRSQERMRAGGYEKSPPTISLEALGLRPSPEKP